jgi:hypothetical protein
VEVAGLDIRDWSSKRTVRVDIGYGGAFYALAIDRDLGVDIKKSSTSEIVRVATLVSSLYTFGNFVDISACHGQRAYRSTSRMNLGSLVDVQIVRLHLDSRRLVTFDL